MNETEGTSKGKGSRPPRIKEDAPKRSKSKGTCGSKELAIEQIARFVDNPDVPMVSPKLAARLAECQGMALAPSRLFADGGRGAAVAQYLARKAQVTKPPKTPDATYDAFESFMQFCTQNTVPPTIGAWAVWNGVTLNRMNQIERDANDAERAHAFGVCKEVLRTFMEQAAWESNLNPLLYFHAQKALYGIVEKSEVTLKVEDNTQEIDDDEYRERVVLLTQGSDGVYSVPDAD